MDVSHGTELHQLLEEVARLKVELEEANHWRARHSSDAEAYSKQSQKNWERCDHLHHALSKCVVALEVVWPSFEYRDNWKVVSDALATARPLLKPDATSEG